MTSSSDSVLHLPAPYKASAVALLGLMAGLQVVDPIISSTAIVSASTTLDFPATVLSLAAGISTLALAATVIPSGLIADRLGRRKVLIYGLLIAVIGDLLVAAIPSTLTFLLGRAIAGIGLGAVFGASYGLLKVVAGDSLGRAVAWFGVWGALTALVLGFAGAALVDKDWQLAYVLVPFAALVCVCVVRRVIPSVPGMPGGPVDYLGMILVGLGVVAILYGVSNASLSLTSPFFWLPVVAGAALLAAFVVTEHWTRNPVFPVWLLHHPAFLGAVVIGIAWNFAAGGFTQMLSNQWQYADGDTATQVGLYQTALTVFAVLGALMAGQLLGRGVVPRTIATVGFALMVAGLMMELIVGSTSGFWFYLPGMALAATGWTMNSTTEGDMFLVLAPKKFYGPVTSSKLTVGQFGYALGLSGSSAVVSLIMLGKVSDRTSGAISGDAEWDSVADYLHSGTTAVPGLAGVPHDELAKLYTQSFQLTVMIFAVVIAIAAVGVYALLSMKKVKIPVEEYLASKPRRVDLKNESGATT